MLEFDYWLIGTFAVVLMLNTWIQYKLGFNTGTKGGYAVGLYHAVSWLMKNNAIQAENSINGEIPSAADLVVHMLKNNISNICFDKPEDLIKIAQATIESEK